MAPYLLSVASGRTPPALTGEQLIAVLERGSEGAFLCPGASARGSLADMLLPDNICASLALLLEKRLTDAWAKRAADEQAAKQQQQVRNPTHHALLRLIRPLWNQDPSLLSIFLPHNLCCLPSLPSLKSPAIHLESASSLST